MDIAALNLAVSSSSLEQANVRLREMPKAASAAERAAERWGTTTNAAARSADDFSKRVQGTIKSLEFERQQLTRTAAEQAKYAALRRAGVAAMSAEGQAIAASVAALQAQRVAAKSSAEATTLHGKAAQAAGSFVRGFANNLGPLVGIYVAIEAARKLWETGLKAGDLGEQAEQIGVNTDQLQAYRLAGAQAGIETEQMDVAITKLAKSMGSAADGNKEMIERFQQLGVKLLDANGQLRPTADVLPEVAKGILGIGSSSQRTATLMDIFGKSGAKMSTVLKDFAEGNDAVIASAREKNAIISPDAIAAWDTLADRMKVTEVRWTALVGEFGAKFALPLIEDLNKFLATTKEEIEGIIGAWGRLVSAMAAAKASAPVIAAQGDVSGIQERLDALRQNPTQFGFKASEKALMDQLAARQSAAQAAQNLANQSLFEMDENNARRGRLPVSAPPLGATSTGRPGVSNPTPKGSGDAAAKAWQSTIDGAKEYIATQAAAQAAIGLSAEAAARLKHETELLNKVQGEGRVATAAQKAEIANLAQAMADADAKFATAKFMDDATTKSHEFVAAQEIEQKALFMSAEAADAYRISQGYLNDAKAKGIELSDVEKQKIAELAGAQAAVAEKTRQAADLYDFAKDTFRGFAADLRQGLMDGKSAWEAFANAGMNALDRIASKLLEMAAQKLFESALGPVFSVIGSAISGAIGGGIGGGGGGGSGTLFATGGVFERGNVIPFATGGIVDRPTVFPFARGVGLMGEAGPEAIMPLRRGRGGRLGVEMGGGGGSGQPVVVYVTGDTDLVRVTANSEAVKVVKAAAPKIESSAVNKATKAAPSAVATDHAERGGDYRT